MTETQVPVAHRDSPYFGLDYYDEPFGAWFFGRENDGSKIITNLRAARLTLLHAESGVGKTSLLRAGVAWRLRRLADDQFARRGMVRSVPVVFSSWKDDPARELAEGIGEAIRPYLNGHAAPELPADDLGAAIETATNAVNASLFIMLDQFEEYFVYRSHETPAADWCADQLALCVNRTDLRANFLIAIREDAYAGLGDLFKGRVTNIYGNYLHIDYLDRASAETAIREPLEVYNSQPGVSQPITLHDELVEAVLDEVRAFGPDAARPGPAAVANGRSNRISTPLLQLVMQRVWDTERAQGSRELRLSTLQQLHGVKMIVDVHLDKALKSLTRAERQTAIDTFDHLVTASGGKIAQSVSDLAKRTGHREDQVDQVLTKLDHEFIVRPIPAAPGQKDPIRSRRYEIFHDVLAPTINRAIAAREEQRHTRRIRRLAALAACLLVIVSAIAIVFALLLKNANDKKLTAESQDLAAQADLSLGQDPELSTSLALEALRLAPTNAAVLALRAALPDLQALRTFHVGPIVYFAAFDPADPTKVLSADFSGIARTWDVNTGRSLTRFSSGGYATTGVAGAAAYNPNGTQVAVGYGDGEVAVFDASNGTKLASTKVGPVIYGIAFVGGTGDLAIATAKNLVLWHAGQTCCRTLLHETTNTIAVNPRNPQELVATTGNSAVIVNASGSGPPTPLPVGAQFIDDAEFSPDGSKVVVADDDGSVDIYGATTRKVVTTLPGGDTAATTVAFSPDGKRVVAGYQNGTGRVWDLATGIQRTLPGAHAATVDTARFSSDGREIVTASEDGTIRVWYTEPRQLRSEFTVPADARPAVIGGAEYIGDRIIAITNDGQLFVSTTNGQTQAVVSPGQAVATIDWDRAGTKIVTSTANGTVKLWRAAGSGYAQIRLRSPVNLNQTTGDVAMSPDGSRFAIVTEDNYTVQVGDANTGGLLQKLDATNPLQYLAFNPGKPQQIVAVDEFGHVEEWNGQDPTPRLLGTPGPILNYISFNRSGSEFVTASASGVVSIWNAHDDQVLRTFYACPSPFTAAFSPDSSMVVVACSDGTVRVFATGNGQVLTVIKATNAGIVSGAEFSPDGTSIVAGVAAANTGDVQVWNAELATSSLPALERIAERLDTQKLTKAQLQQYLNGASN